LRVGHALVPARTLESGSTRLEARIATCKETVVCVSDALGDVLQHLGVDVGVFGVLLLQSWEKHVEGVLRGQRRTAPAVVEQGVIYVFAVVEVAL